MYYKGFLIEKHGGKYEIVMNKKYMGYSKTLAAAKIKINNILKRKGITEYSLR